MPFGIDAENGFAVFQKERRGMAKVLSLLAIDDDLAGGLIVQIQDGERVRGVAGEGEDTKKSLKIAHGDDSR
jgi:hypothetical protein